MSDLVVTGVIADKKIQAIKGLRSLDSLTLLEAKNAIERLPLTPHVIRDATPAMERVAQENSLEVEWRPTIIHLRTLREWLGVFPEHLTVGDLKAVVGALAASNDPTAKTSAAGGDSE